MPPKHRHWYNRRTHKDAPSHLADQAYTTFGAWAEGYNAAVKACVEEMAEVARKEGLTGDDW